MNFLEMLLGGSPAQARMEETLDKDPKNEADAAIKAARQIKGPIDDGGFTRNVLMKGIPGMEDKTPSFTGKDGVAWMSPVGDLDADGKGPTGIPITPNDLPPSPIKPELQTVMPAAKPAVIPVQQKAVKEVKKANTQQKKALAAEAPKEEKEPEAEEVESSEAPQESALDKLLRAYNDPVRDTEMEEAQGRRNDLMRQLSMLKSMQEVGAGLGGYRADKDFLSGQMELAGQPVKDIEQRREQERKMKAEKAEGLKLGMDVERFKQDSEAKGIDMEKARLQLKDAKANKDPNSDISKATKNAIEMRFQMAGVKAPIPNGLSADQYRSMFPMGDIVDDLIKERGRKESAAQRKADKEERDKLTKDNRQQALITHMSDKIKQVDDKIGYNKALSDYEMLKDRMMSGKFDSVSDVTTTYALMKALDPGSVVRESEFDTLVNSQGGLEKLKRMPDRFFKGNIYSPQFRQKLLEQFGGVVDARRKQLHKVLEPDLKRAKDLGIDESYILAPATSKSFADAGKSITKKEYSKSRNQTRITYSDGSQELVDGQK